jgi:hypothetical protein
VPARKACRSDGQHLAAGHLLHDVRAAVRAHSGFSSVSLDLHMCFENAPSMAPPDVSHSEAEIDSPRLQARECAARLIWTSPEASIQIIALS